MPAALLRQPLHRPLHSLPRRSGLRSLQGVSVDRRNEDGALRPGRERHHVLARHGNRVSRRRSRQRRVWIGRKRRSGVGGSGRIHGVQADLRAGQPLRAAQDPRQQEDQDGVRRGRTREATRNVPTPQAERDRFCITDEDVLTLADYAVKIERHYSRKAGRPVPMDMEWAKDGLDQQLYVVQARPRPWPRTSRAITSRNSRCGAAARYGSPAARWARASAPGRRTSSRTSARSGSSSPARSWSPTPRRRLGTRHEECGRDRHQPRRTHLPRRHRRARIRIPAVIGCDDATEKLASGEAVTVSCAEGDTGKVYQA